ncbi:MAG: BBP7 family outer membrane beta-barrel protein [Planctomycetaceae bacterium]
MTGRNLAMTLAAWGCGLATPCLAQGYGGAPGYSAPGDVVTLPPEAGGYGYSSGAFGDASAMGGVSSPGYGAPPAYCPPGGGEAAYCPPEPEPWWKRRGCMIDKRWLKPARGSFVRLEYLLWEIEEPGTESFGAPFPQDFSPGTDIDFDENFLDIDFDPSEGFFDFNPELGTFGPVYVPNNDEIQLRDNSGVRVTFGIPTYEYGTIELSGWALEQASDHYEFRPRFDDFFFFFGTTPAISFATDVGDTPVTVGFGQVDTVYTSDLLGADANFVIDSLSPEGEGLKLKPLVGFKYVSLQEFQSVAGYSPTSPLLGPGNFALTSDTDNNYLGGTLGLRTELEHRWFILGLQPAVTFAGNIAKARVQTAPFFDPTEGTRETSSDYFDFAPILDLKAYARICLSDNLRLNVGYDAFWISKAYRAADVIDYRVDTDGGTTLESASSTERSADDVAVEGLSVGLEYIF